MEAKDIKGIINEQHWSEIEINNMGKIIQMTLPTNVYADLDLSQIQDWQIFGLSLTKDILNIPIIYQNLLRWSWLDKTKVLLVLENQDVDTGDPEKWFKLMTQIPQTRGYIPPGVGIINDDPHAFKMLTYTEQILIQSDGVSRPIILQSLEYLLGIIFNLIEEDDHQTLVDIMAELTGRLLELTNRSEVHMKSTQENITNTILQWPDNLLLSNRNDLINNIERACPLYILKHILDRGSPETSM